MLHIVNGDSVAEKLRQGGVQGKVMPWTEIYSYGPVFPNMADSSRLAARAEYLETTLGIPQHRYRETCEKQLQVLEELPKGEEVVLWFEYDLYDQTMLIFLLDWFSRRPYGEIRLNLLCIGSYPGVDDFRGMGQLTQQQLMGLAGTWHPVSREELELGRKAWQAYSSPDPEEHLRLLGEDTAALPYLRDAFEAHLARLPSVRNGAGIVEQTVLDLVAEGCVRPLDLFGQAGSRLRLLGMGDLEFWRHLEAMTAAPQPLLSVRGISSFPDFGRPDPSPLREAEVSFTELGRKVKAGDADWMAFRNTDWWYGGLHMRGKEGR